MQASESVKLKLAALRATKAEKSLIKITCLIKSMPEELQEHIWDFDKSSLKQIGTFGNSPQ